MRIVVWLLLLLCGPNSNTSETKDKYLFVYETKTNVFIYVLALTQKELDDLVKETRLYAPCQIGKMEEPYGDMVLIVNDKNKILFRIFLDSQYSFRHTLANLEQKQRK
jgi:hypothetical protein